MSDKTTQADTWFKVRRNSYSASKIEPVTVERHTQTSVWIQGRLKPQITSYECYHPTWEAAHAQLLDDAERNVQSIRLQLERANGLLGNVKGMKKPGQS